MTANFTYRKTRLKVWQRVLGEDKVIVRREYADGGWAEHQHAKRRTSWDEDTTIELRIDEKALMDFLGDKAARSKSGRAKALNGILVAVVKSRVIRNKQTVEVPIPDGYIEKLAKEWT